jgi:hypothetical protein
VVVNLDNKDRFRLNILAGLIFIVLMSIVILTTSSQGENPIKLIREVLKVIMNVRE